MPDSIPLPAAFAERLRREFPERAEAVLEALRRPGSRGLRLNPLRGPVSLPWETERVPWAENGFRLIGEGRPGLHPFHHAGVYYLQEPAAMLPAQKLADAFGTEPRVLDLCAAPGGKSTQLAALLPPDGLLLSNDIQPGRACALLGNLERFGAARAVVTSATPSALAERFPSFFTHALVDAPCSGEGMFRRDENARAEWDEGAPERCHRRQTLLLGDAARLVAPGGVLVYSTCTFNRLENEGTVEAFLRAHPDFSADGLWRLWPDDPMGEGHFCCRLRRSGEGEQPISPPPRPDPKAEALRAALEASLGVALPGTAALEGGYLTLPALPAERLRGLPVLRNGLQLALPQRGRLLPAHALSMALRPGEGPSAELSWPEAQRYLHGEALERETPRGDAVARFAGQPLGWLRGADGRLNNRLPKGLRSVSPSRDEP